jgi:hypothetical protein
MLNARALAEYERCGALSSAARHEAAHVAYSRCAEVRCGVVQWRLRAALRRTPPRHHPPGRCVFAVHGCVALAAWFAHAAAAEACCARPALRSRVCARRAAAPGARADARFERAV